MHDAVSGCTLVADGDDVVGAGVDAVVIGAVDGGVPVDVVCI